ncbi:hypothetical protein PCASD_02921 [Puccinia coronata f. sp. avenae]|uniref:Uncharacterized protein n=1 Tax=Puccinia coronata f. sp. avenae TaxID=200324 RepID=A0A2N5VEH7_9BASI|nr:hypothetical protein PCASD_15220 [Puccinia coronata f. sp. avenae]PLW48403.1 hypothetical protein PCASD_02921 [Puccinia coronata f. sp. avenae]
MISIHKLLLVTLFCAAAQSLAQAQTNTSSSTAGATAADAGQSSTSGDIPLYQKRFTWPNLPYQADTGNGPRGTQQGYNRCNATTQNQASMCQTTLINSIQDKSPFHLSWLFLDVQACLNPPAPSLPAVPLIITVLLMGCFQTRLGCRRH